MKKASARDILGLIPDEVFQEVSAETQVDKHVKKLTGRSIFQVFLLSLMGGSPSSLTVMSRLFSSEKVRLLCGEASVPFKTNKTSISDRLNNINFEFFEKIFTALVQKFDRLFTNTDSQKITSFDSTVLTLSSRLLRLGCRVGRGEKNQIKFTISFDQIPRKLNIHFADNCSDEISLRTAIREFSVDKNSIAVFDRGLYSRNSYKEFDDSGIQFITRQNNTLRYQIIKHLNDVSRLRASTLESPPPQGGGIVHACKAD
jgi:transposase